MRELPPFSNTHPRRKRDRPTSPLGSLSRNPLAQRLRLMARLARRYDLAHQTVRLRCHQIEMVIVAEPHRMREAGQPNSPEESDPATQPYWAQTWQSSYVVAEAVEPMDLVGRRVLDLGCGLGLVGAAAALRGAHVVMADAVTPALLFARLNAWPWRDRVLTRQLDWRRDCLPGDRFQLILGADILYDAEDWPYLDAFWRVHLEQGGEVLLGEPNRIGSESFPLWIADRGWHVTSTAISHASQKWPFRLLRLRSRSASWQG